MHSCLESSYVLQVVVEFLGFVPSTFYLRACSRYLHSEVTGVTFSNEADFLKAMDRRLVNPKFLKLRASAVSDSLISWLLVGVHNGTGSTARLKSFLEGRSFRALVNAGIDPKLILEYSVICIDLSMFDQALKCMESRGDVGNLIRQLLGYRRVQSVLMKADALDLLSRMVVKLNLPDKSHFGEEDLMVCATKFGAVRCANYLESFTGDRTRIPSMLEAYAYTGDFAGVKLLCTADRRPWPGLLFRALYQAVIRQHVHVAAYLRSQWEALTRPSNSDRISLVKDLFKTIERSGNPLPELSEGIVSCIFEGIEDVKELRIRSLSMLDYACCYRQRTMGHFLVGKGCRTFFLARLDITLEKNDLLNFLDLYCASTERRFRFEDPAVESFLLKRGVHIRKKDVDKNPVFQVLAEGYECNSLANRVELIKAYLDDDPRLASKAGRFYVGRDSVGDWGPWVTPLGALELIGTPMKEAWTGESLIGYAGWDNKEETDVWKRWEPNEIEIQAVRDIRTALIDHGADPDYLFAPSALNHLIMTWEDASFDLVKRMIHGRADVNNKDLFGVTPLSLALQRRHFVAFNKFKLAHILLACGADLNAAENHARAKRDVEAIEWLAKNGAKSNAPDSDRK